MRNGSRTTRGNTSTPATVTDDDVGPFTTTSSYLISTNAIVTLRFVRDELKLLASLAEPRNDDDRDDIVLSTEALSDCFSRIAEQLDEVLSGVQRFA